MIKLTLALRRAPRSPPPRSSPKRRPAPPPVPVDRRAVDPRAARRRARQRPLCVGHHRGADDRSRAAPGRDRRRGPRPRLGVAKLKAMGFANVRVETFDMPVWVRGPESAEILAPFPQKLVVAALGNPASTGPAGVTGEIVAFDSVDALRAAPDAAVRGKIVFIDHRMPANQDGSGYGQFGAPRRQGPTIASQKGAIAIVVRSIGTDHHRNPHTGVMSFADGAKPIPAGALTIPDAEQLVRILKRGKPVTMRLRLESTTIASAPVGQRHRRSPRPRSRARADPRRRPPRQLGPGHRRDRRCRGRRHRRRGGEAHHGRRAPAAHDPHRLVRGRGSRPVRRARLSRPPRQGAALRRSPKATSAPTASGRSTASLARRAATRRA